MGRKESTNITTTYNVAVVDTPGITGAANDIALSLDQHTNDTLEMGIMLGKVQALMGVAALSETAALNIFQALKNNKGWKGLKKPDGSGYASLKDACEPLIGRSYRRLQQMETNRLTLGTEAFAHASEIGLRQLDYDTINKMPDEDQQVIKRVLEDKAAPDEVRSALEKLITHSTDTQQQLAKSRAEIGEAKTNLASTLADLESSRDRLKQKQEALEEANDMLRLKDQELDSQREVLARASVSDQQKMIHAKTVEVMMQINATISTTLRGAFHSLGNYQKDFDDDEYKLLNANPDDEIEEVKDENEIFLSAVCDSISAAVNLLRGDFGLTEGIVSPHWKSDQAKTLLEIREVKNAPVLEAPAPAEPAPTKKTKAK
jgi:hypothetical protein